MDTARRKVLLDVGGGDKNHPLPEELQQFVHLLLDIDPRGKPDFCMDARDMQTLRPNLFDAVYCSHNLEHFYFHEVPVVLKGMYHVLKPGGFMFVRVPDILTAIQTMLSKGVEDFEEGLYMASGTPIMVLDVIYGWHIPIERSGQDYYQHKTAFTEKSLKRKVAEAGFEVGDFLKTNFEFQIIGYKN